MPDPWRYLQATLWASAACALVICVAGRCGAVRREPVYLGAWILGGLVGCWALASWPRWPLTTGLDRWLGLLLPGALLIESCAGSAACGSARAWLARGLLSGLACRVLLHDSVYLQDLPESWSRAQTLAISGVTGAALLANWRWLTRDDNETTAAVRLCALALALGCAGCAIMLGGYLKGGAVALPLAAVTLCCALLPWRGPHGPRRELIGCVLVALFGLLMVGHFFGGLTQLKATVIFLSPALCRIPSRCRNSASDHTVRSFRRDAARIGRVAIPLALTLWLAKQEFDARFRPLLLNETQRPLQLDKPRIRRYQGPAIESQASWESLRASES